MVTFSTNASSNFLLYLLIYLHVYLFAANRDE